MNDPIVVEHISVPKGIDIGQTLIGMHIKHVCVPVRTSVKQVGEAIVTIATSRPKKSVVNELNTNKLESVGGILCLISKIKIKLSMKRFKMNTIDKITTLN